jgi:hypothetical protein
LAWKHDGNTMEREEKLGEGWGVGYFHIPWTG